MKKKETFYQKEKRVYKELSLQLKDNGAPSNLTDDQRTVLLGDWGSITNKCFNFSSYANHSAWDENISIKQLEDGFADALEQAAKYATSKKLMYPSYSLGDNGHCSIMVVGFKPISDQILIDNYVADVMAERREREQEKKEKLKAKKAKKNINSKEEAIKEIARLAKRFSI